MQVECTYFLYFPGYNLGWEGAAFLDAPKEPRRRQSAPARLQLDLFLEFTDDDDMTTTFLLHFELTYQRSSVLSSCNHPRNELQIRTATAIMVVWDKSPPEWPHWLRKLEIVVHRGIAGYCKLISMNRNGRWNRVYSLYTTFWHERVQVVRGQDRFLDLQVEPKPMALDLVVYRPCTRPSAFPYGPLFTCLRASLVASLETKVRGNTNHTPRKAIECQD